jgi:hypothetical protein
MVMNTLKENDLNSVIVVTKRYKNVSTISDDVKDQFYDDVLDNIWNLGIGILYLSTLTILKENNIKIIWKL